MKKVVYLLLSLLVFSGCLKNDELKLKTKDYQPQLLNDGWQIDTISEANYSISVFNDIVDAVYSEYDNLYLRSLLIVREGKLLAEMYPQTKADRDNPHQLWSATKSIVSLIAGIAIDNGYIKSVNDGIMDYLPEYVQYASEEHSQILIEHCLTMRSGINYDNDGKEEEELLAQIPDDLTKYIIQLPIASTPGIMTFYKNSDPQLLVKAISNATKTDFVSFADNNLFEPMGISNSYWSRNKDNTPYGGFGLWFKPRDLAKIGQLMLNKGMWEGNQLISSDWISEAVANNTSNLYGYKYGYLIWTDSTNKRYWFWGKGGQFLFVVPEHQLVVVLLSEQFTDEGGTSIEKAMSLIDEIIACIK
jgi:CubicO group peptidase (beta-lactamase class C family)